jgi:hypothetical protein
MNDWRIHYSIASTLGITQVNNAVYMATSNGVVVYDTEDNSLSDLTISNGLSDINISCIKSENETLIIGYQNGNIDIIKDNLVTNIPWLKLAPISGSKIINDVYFTSSYVYISTNIGILVLDIEKKEIKDTYYPNPKQSINDLCVFSDSFYVATPNGIFTASIYQEFLNDVNNWNKKTNLPTSIVNSNIKEIESFNGYLCFAYDTTVYNADSIYVMSTNQAISLLTNGNINKISKTNNSLMLAMGNYFDIYDDNLQLKEHIYEYNFSQNLNVIEGIFFKEKYWLADKNNGLVTAVNSFNNDQIYSNTPFSNTCYSLDIQYGKVLVAGGGLNKSYQNNYFRSGAYSFENEEWINFNYKTDPVKMDINNTWDVISVAINPNNINQMALGTYSKSGLKLINDGKTIDEVFDNYNSPLEDQSGNPDVQIVSGLSYDGNGNLWIANPGSNGLKMFSKDKTWYQYNTTNLYITKLMIDSKNNKWLATKGGGLIVYNENETLDDLTDDQKVVLNTNEGYGSLPSSTVTAIAEDVDGEIWIGTESGLVVLYSTDNLFGGSYGDADAKPIKIDDGENVELLLGESEITSIAVDGGNRKWIGTSSSGVFCFSPNGLEEIYRFNSDNSPLLSDNVLDIKINHITGEVFFATENGLISYRADATIGDEEFSSVSVFPNPVKPEYRGNITVQGLGYNSEVKITDVSGNLIYQTISNGGTVVWDGNRLSGDRVQSGVYLIWAASSTGKGKNVAKLVVIN